MGCDPKGILYYGVKLDAEPEFDDMDANDAWAEANRPAQPEDKSDYKTPAWEEWREKLRVYEKSPRNVEIDWSGTDECHDEGWYVHCEGLEKTVTWDQHLEIGGMDLAKNHPEADAAIKEFCERFGLEYKTPSWHLACRYF